MQIDIINPKATKILKDLADLNLIQIRKPSEDSIINILKKFRKRAKANAPTLNEITKEVELVRAKRYAKSKG